MAMFAERIIYTATLLVTASLLVACGGGGGGGGGGTGSEVITFAAVPVNGSTTSGNLQADASDYYNFQGIAGVTYTISLLTTSGDADLAVTSSSDLEDLNSLIDFSINTGTAPDTVTFVAPTTQNYYIEVYGFEASSYRISISTSGTLNTAPQLNATPPVSASPGVPVSFQVVASDADSDPVTLDLLSGPGGMSIDDQGFVTWTPENTILDTSLVSWVVSGSDGKDTTVLSGTIQVNDASRQQPIVRSGIEVPASANGLRTADFDGDGKTEILVTSDILLYTLEFDGSSYIQDWVYPYNIVGAEGRIASLGVYDLNGDGRPEILAGIDTGPSGSVDTKVVILDGVTRKVSGELPIASTKVTAIRVSDTDSDGDPELVILAHNNDGFPGTELIFVYDVANLTLEWQSTAISHGQSLAVGNLDGDVYPEIVTSNGYVYGFNGTTYVNEWLYGSGFGFQVGIGDTDGDGVNEIIGAIDWTAVQAYDMVTKAVIWSVSTGDLQSLEVVDIDNDLIDEVLVGDGQWGNVTAYSYNTSTGSVDIDWQINSQNHGVSSISVGNVDSDSDLEFIWASGTTSSGPNSLVVAGLNPGISVEWTNEMPQEIDGPFNGAQWLSMAPGDERATFVSPATDNGFGSTRLITLDSAGNMQLSSEIGNNWNSAAVFSGTDYDQDGIDEIFLSSSEITSGYFTVFDFLADVSVWTSPPDMGKGVATAYGDLNGDGYGDFAVITREGYVRAFDVFNQTLIWDSGYLGDSGNDIEIVDLDGDGENEIVIASDSFVRVMQSVVTGYGIRSSIENIDIIDMDIGDIDGDGQLDIVIGEGDNFLVPTLVKVYDTSLNQVSVFEAGKNLRALFIEKSAHQRKNLVLSLAIEETPVLSTRGFLSWVDPYSGNEVFRSRNLLGVVQKNSLNFADVDQDGENELLFGTDKAMYLTR